MQANAAQIFLLEEATEIFRIPPTKSQMSRQRQKPVKNEQSQNCDYSAPLNFISKL